ncbi:MAG: ATP-binding protein [Lachnospiraceae bacterium]|nr:ATP-binding protein [Lachnospiraceae bacterium]
MNIDKLLLYKVDENSTLYRFAALIEKAKNHEVDSKECYDLLSKLINFGLEHGFYDNLWHCYITYIMVYNENSYSMNCEMKGMGKGTLESIADHDFEILKELFDFDINDFGIDMDMDSILEFSNDNLKGRVFNKRISDNICELSNNLEKCDSVAEFKDQVVDFYKRFGVGILGLHKAFRLSDDGEITPITGIAHVSLDDLCGYENQKKKLMDNTNAFVAGRKANNCLLYGDAGTGKSTSIKAIANMYYDKGVRIIEIYKHQFKYINKIISKIKNRNYYFILYMDDLSFEEFEIEYKYLKAVIEGGLEKKPSNILIYATSNRRHLIRESFKDNTEVNDLHKSDTKQEKLSLADRFGVTIYYGAPTPKEFKQIVLALRDNNNIDMDDDEILLEANKWELHHNGLSGRTAQQFIDYLLGFNDLNERN